MSSPTTADIRNWAQSKGLEVGARGRLPDELRAAYQRAHASKTSRPTPASPAAKKASATRKTTAARPTASRAIPSPPKASRSKAPVAKTSVRAAKTPGPVNADLAARVTQLEAQIAALTERLNTSAPAKRRAPRRPGK